MSFVVKNGRVIDPATGHDAVADVLIDDGVIREIGRGLSGSEAFDASGLIVAPGFIDMLGQSETSVLIDPNVVSKVTQGVTTEITGEGESIAPQNDFTIAEAKDFRAR